MRSHDHPHIHFDCMISVNAFHFRLFQNAQQLGLHHQGHIADLIEEDGSTLRLFELAEMPRASSGE